MSDDLMQRDSDAIRATLARLEQSWWSVADASGVAPRRAITAQLIGPALPHAFIAERIAPGHARIRVAGQELASIVGTELRGMPLSCLLGVESRTLFADRLAICFERPAIVDMPLHAPRRFARPALDGRMLLLPLMGDDGIIDRLLGALVLDGEIGHRPRRLEIDQSAPWRRDTLTGPRPQRLRAIAGGAHLRRSAYAPRPELRLVVDNG